MYKKKTLMLFVITMAMLSAVFIATVSSTLIYAQNEVFKAKLKGQNEVPAVTTSATGNAKFRVKGDIITSVINITGITNVTGAHIHAGQKGQNGEPVVDLIKTGKQIKTNEGVTIKGKFNSSDLQGPMAGKTLQNLTTAMSNEQVYVNVHTNAHPDGEIRAQIKVCACNATKADFDVNSSSVFDRLN